EEAGEGRHPDEDVHFALAAEIGEAAMQALPHALVTVELLFRVLDANKCPKNGDKTEGIEKKVSGHAEEGHGVSAQSGTEDTRGIELRRVESDGVGEVFTLDELRHQRLVAGGVHGHGHSVAEGDGGHSPDRDLLKPGKTGEQEGQQHHYGLGDEQETA